MRLAYCNLHQSGQVDYNTEKQQQQPNNQQVCSSTWNIVQCS